MTPHLTLLVGSSSHKEVGRGIGRIHPDHLTSLQLEIGDIIQITGKRKTVVRVMPSFPEKRQDDHIFIDGIIQQNALTGIGEKVEIKKIEVTSAKKVLLTSTINMKELEEKSLSRLLYISH